MRPADLQGTYLADIVAGSRARAAADRRDLDALARAATAAAPPADFASALVGPEVAVIAEIKRRSPSRGDLAPGLDPGAVAADYAAGGAACLSVLTDVAHFGGNPDDLRAARAAAGIPALRKDFTVCDADVYDARLMGADAVLLIVAALDDDELARLRAVADALGLAALVEAHDEAELERAFAAGATLVGVNQRDLRTFTVDRGRAARLAACIPPSVTAVAESGLRDAEDVRRAGDAGYDAVLVGESLVTAADRAGAARALTGQPARRRAVVGG